MFSSSYLSQPWPRALRGSLQWQCGLMERSLNLESCRLEVSLLTVCGTWDKSLTLPEAWLLLDQVGATCLLCSIAGEEMRWSFVIRASYWHLIGRGSVNFSVKGRTVNILGFSRPYHLGQATRLSLVAKAAVFSPLFYRWGDQVGKQSVEGPSKWQRPDLNVGRRGFTIKLMNLKLRGTPPAYATSGALEWGHVFIHF